MKKRRKTHGHAPCLAPRKPFKGSLHGRFTRIKQGDVTPNSCASLGPKPAPPKPTACSRAQHPQHSAKSSTWVLEKGFPQTGATPAIKTKPTSFLGNPFNPLLTPNPPNKKINCLARPLTRSDSLAIALTPQTAGASGSSRKRPWNATWAFRTMRCKSSRARRAPGEARRGTRYFQPWNAWGRRCILRSCQVTRQKCPCKKFKLKESSLIYFTKMVMFNSTF